MTTAKTTAKGGGKGVKFVTSRKLWAAVASFVVVSVLPHVPTDTKAKYGSLIAAAYVVAQGVADAFGSGDKPSQGM